VDTGIVYSDHLKDFIPFFEDKDAKWSSVFILVDSNTHQYCLPFLLKAIPTLKNVEILEVDPGEESKDIEIATGLWLALNDLNADRRSLLINLGGGMICDLGAWVAVNYKRGIDFIHIPTTLLAMVDASLGGKSGINLGGIKNLVGSFTKPLAVLNHLPFLDSLPDKEWHSGFAEMLKHALISDKGLWDKMKNISPDDHDEISGLIEAVASVKRKIVDRDFKENGDRKKLNFGHTIGHAIESLSIEKGKALSHGHSVAIGMALANSISSEMDLLPEEIQKEINSFLYQLYTPPKWLYKENKAILSKVLKDKKNEGESIKMVLLKKVGGAVIDIQIKEDQIIKALKSGLEEYSQL